MINWFHRAMMKVGFRKLSMKDLGRFRDLNREEFVILSALEGATDLPMWSVLSNIERSIDEVVYEKNVKAEKARKYLTNL